MAYREPSVPAAAGDARSAVQALARFLRDFCQAAWTADRNKDEEIARIKMRLDKLEGKK